MNDKKNRLALYMHAGSDNHGCEAIVSSLSDMLKESLPDEKVTLLTNSKEEDERYLTADNLSIVEENHIRENLLTHVRLYLYRALTKDRESFLRYRMAPIVGKENAPEVAVSIGGDNYCYPEMVEDLMLANRVLTKQGTRTMLLGCSIEPEMFRDNTALVEDMQRYERILARESITRDALLSAGVPEEKVNLVPDPAFTLKPLFHPLPEKFVPGKMVGINVSPMVQSYAAHGDLVLRSYRNLIHFLLKGTEYSIALIPHVVWKNNNDLQPLSELYREFRDTGRVLLMENRSAAALKACIAGCMMFVGARTHATIAAYSSMVPTLVVGYSVKARGIARDLFGEEDHYVLPVQSMEDTEQLVRDFRWIMDNRETIHHRLKEVMPFYIMRAKQNAEEICSLIKK
ncbi:MAG: polysaccharide pyruvyl transferase family protein [Lachnospiraceae bacterium]|nr:polysaccharide pyruvyl transferase family protein [Lachnospiraceae bacterium]